MGSAFILAFVHRRAEPPLQETIRKKGIHEVGAPWNGGKSRGPLLVENTVAGSIPANRETVVSLSLSFQSECEEAKVAIRGLDGLEVLSGGELISFRPCRLGEKVEHRVVVRASEGAEGLLVIDSLVRMSADHTAGSVEQGYTQALLIKTEGALKTKAKSMGKLSQSPGRAPLVELGGP